MAYLDQNKREFELTKNFSLLMIDPLELIKLRETGRCEFELPERLFEFDYPGHYMRRIRSVSLTIPCVTGPYTNINCTLTLLSSRIRVKNNPARPFVWDGGDDDRFVTNFSAMQSISTSHAQNDSGLFELNFRDERYLPFEGAGAISRWRIEMPKECNAFDFKTLSDVVLQLRYTAKDGGEALRTAAKEEIVDATPRDGVRLFSARHEFPTEWHRFLNPEVAANEQRLEFSLTREHFPFMAQGGSLTISRLELFLLIKDRQIFVGDNAPYVRETVSPLRVSLMQPDHAGATSGSRELTRNNSYGDVPHTTIPLDSSTTLELPLTVASNVPLHLLINAQESDIATITSELKQTITTGGVSHTRLKADAIEDIVMILWVPS